MRILDRYILKSVLGLFSACLFIFFSLYIVIDVFAHLQEILKQRVAVEILVKYYLAFLPIIFVQVSPIACLLSVLYTFGKLNRNNEIIAMRSSGLSVFQINKTVFIFGLIICIIIFWVNDRLLPQSLSLTEKFKEQIETGVKKTHEHEHEVITNLCMYGMKNRLFFIGRFSPATDTLEEINILEHDHNQNMTKKIVAKKGIFIDGAWKFYQATTYEFDENGQIKYSPHYLEEEIMDIPETPQDFLNQRQRPAFMDIKQLNGYIGKLSASGATGVIQSLKVELYQRFTTPLTAIIIMLLGIPFALMMKKRATGMSSIGISIMVGFLYYVLNAVSIAMGMDGILIPILAASLSHIIALIFSFYMIFKLP